MTENRRVSTVTPVMTASESSPDETTSELLASDLKVGSRVLGHFRLEQLLEQGEDSLLYLADNEERSELVLLVFAKSAQALAACLAGPAAGTVLHQTTFGSWHIAEVMLQESHLHKFADELLAPPDKPAATSTLQSSRAPLEARLADGSIFAKRYRVEGLRGRGGMGEVYRAYDTTFERAVALKVVRVEASEGTSDREAAKRRLLNEARVVSALEHPHIVAIHDAGESDGLPYLVLELCDGGNLRKAIADGASEDDRFRWLAQVAEALAHAHDQGIVHRDVKPENVLLTSDGNAKVADFGIAKALQRDPARASTTIGIVGTPLYMAPEQLFGGIIDARADQYAWGLVAHELLTGLHPRARNIDVPSADPSDVTGRSRALGKPRVPARVRGVLARAMASEPRARYADFRALLSDLRRPPRNRLRSILGVTGVVALVGTALVGLPSTHRGGTETVGTLATADVTAAAPVAGAIPFPGLLGTALRAASAADPPTEELRSTIQRWIDGEISYATFDALAKRYPHSAVLAMLCAVTGPYWPTTQSREQFATSYALRSRLPPELQPFLDALRYLYMEPPDPKETARQLTKIVASSQDDALLLDALAIAHIAAGDFEEALIVLAHLKQSAPWFAHAYARTGLVYGFLGRADDAQESFRACAERFASSAACLYLDGQLRSSLGHCERSVELTRAAMTAQPNLRLAYLVGAQAKAASGGAATTVSAILEQGIALASETERDALGGPYRFGLAVRSSSASDIHRALDRWEHAVASGRSLNALRLYTVGRLRYSAEQGDGAAAREAIDFYRARASGIQVSDAYFDDPGMEPEGLAHQFGVTSPEEFDKYRTQWVAREKKRPARFARETWIWLTAFATAVRDERDAQGALAALPDSPYLDDLFSLEARDNLAIGRTFALAGHDKKALEFLERARSSCSVLFDPFSAHWAELEMAKIMARSHRRDEACDRYESLHMATDRRGADAIWRRTGTEVRTRLVELGCRRKKQ